MATKYVARALTLEFHAGRLQSRPLPVGAGWSPGRPRGRESQRSIEFGPSTAISLTPSKGHISLDAVCRELAVQTAHEVRLLLSLIAYNLGNLWRRLVLPQRIGNWSLTSLQQRLVKTGGRLIKHARYYWLLLAESHLTRRLFASMVRRIAGLPLPSG